MPQEQVEKPYLDFTCVIFLPQVKLENNIKTAHLLWLHFFFYEGRVYEEGG